MRFSRARNSFARQRSSKAFCRVLLGGMAVLFFCSGAGRASAQFSEYATREKKIESPERLVWELLRAGTYEAAANQDARYDVFSGDKGPMLATELDYLIYRIPFLGWLAAGASVGWAKFEAKAFVDPPENLMRSNEDTSLILYPLAALAVLRVDTLARDFSVPILFAGKIGVDVIPWRAATGGSTEGNGTSVGLHWGAQVALELDFIDRPSARSLDEEWGINHSFIFFEVYGSTLNTSLAVGDPLTWVAGLGLVL